jgi:hypothetical protein
MLILQYVLSFIFFIFKHAQVNLWIIDYEVYFHQMNSYRPNLANRQSTLRLSSFVCIKCYLTDERGN